MDEISIPKEFAPEYSEYTEEKELEELTVDGFKYGGTIDITYETHSGTKTVRAISATPPVNNDDLSESVVTFYDDGDQYGFDTDNLRLLSVNYNGRNVTLADNDEIVKVEKVNRSGEAPVVGGIEKGVEATVYYRSPRSDEMQTVTIEVENMEGEAGRIYGEDVNNPDRRIEANSTISREIVSKKGLTERTIGRVARIEFPRGRKFDVDIEGITEEQAESVKNYLPSKIEGIFGGEDIEVNVTYTGEMEWD